MNDTGKKIILGSGVIVAAVAMGYLALQPGDVVPEVAPLPEWRETRPDVAAVPAMETRSFTLSGLTLGGSPPQLSGTGEIALSEVAEMRPAIVDGVLSPATPLTVIIDASVSLAPFSMRVKDVRVFAGAVEQAQARDGTLQVASAQLNAPAVPAWLDGWLWPTWRGASHQPS